MFRRVNVAFPDNMFVMELHVKFKKGHPEHIIPE